MIVQIHHLRDFQQIKYPTVGSALQAEPLFCYRFCEKYIWYCWIFYFLDLPNSEYAIKISLKLNEIFYLDLVYFGNFLLFLIIGGAHAISKISSS